MTRLARAAGLLILAAVSVRGLAAAQQPQSPSPAWAYGLPQLVIETTTTTQ